MAAVRDNKALNRFEMDVEDAMAFANYRLTPDAVIITHTETPRALRGRGIASELVKGALELIRADGRKVIAGCGFRGRLSRQASGICGSRSIGRHSGARQSVDTKIAPLLNDRSSQSGESAQGGALPVVLLSLHHIRKRPAERGPSSK